MENGELTLVLLLIYKKCVIFDVAFWVRLSKFTKLVSEFTKSACEGILGFAYLENFA